MTIIRTASNQPLRVRTETGWASFTPWVPEQVLRTNHATNPDMVATDGEVVVAENLMPNGSFETGTDGWSITRGTVAADTTHAYVGTQSAKVSDTDSGSTYFIYDQQDCTPGTVLPLTARVWTADAQSVHIGLYFYDSTGVNFSNERESTTTTAGQWSDLAASITVPDGAATMRMTIWLDGPQGVDYWLDAVGLGTSAFFDSSTPADDTFTYRLKSDGSGASQKVARTVSGWKDAAQWGAGAAWSTDGGSYDENMAASSGQTWAYRVTFTNPYDSDVVISQGLRTTVGGGFAGGHDESTDLTAPAHGAVETVGWVNVAEGEDGFRFRVNMDAEHLHVHWTDLLIERVSAPSVNPGPYFDGNTTAHGTGIQQRNYRWTGDANASTSEEYLPQVDEYPLGG
jgi:hypothetical protein